MMWSTRAVLAAALVVVCSVPALAQVGGHPVEISAGAGMMHFDTRARIQDGASFGGGLGLRVTPWVSFEVAGLFAPSKSKLNTSVNHTFLLVGGDLRWNLRPAENRVVPFFLTGVGYGMSHSDARSPTKSDEPAGSLGLGLLYN